MPPSEFALLDSSYIVRYLTNDPPEMAVQAAAAIDSEQPLCISEVILAESAYVLTSVYKVPRDMVVDTLISLIHRQNIRLTMLPKLLAVEVLQLCRDSKRYSFADVLLWAEARHLQAKGVYTFYQRFPPGADILE
ncbi:MAG: PIN domain-containing protein [Caldilineaceae bacterium]|nr:PIN domain-containing protein [Caldilineaceae bacterium]